MFDSYHAARPIAFVRGVDLEDRSLERVRYIKIAAVIKGERVRRWSVVAKKDRVLAAVWVTDVSLGRRSYALNRSNVFNGRGLFEVRGYALNLRCLSHKRSHVSDVNLLVPRVKLNSQKGRLAEISLGDELAVFSKSQKFVGVGAKIESGYINFSRLGIGGDPFRETRAFWQRNESFRRIPFHNNFFARPCFAVRCNDQGHECHK